MALIYNINNHWYQQHLAQKNLNISFKILTNYANTNTTTLLWAFQTHNLSFKNIKTIAQQTQHQWRTVFYKTYTTADKFNGTK